MENIYDYTKAVRKRPVQRWLAKIANLSPSEWEPYMAHIKENILRYVYKNRVPILTLGAETNQVTSKSSSTSDECIACKTFYKFVGEPVVDFNTLYSIVSHESACIVVTRKASPFYGSALYLWTNTSKTVTLYLEIRDPKTLDKTQGCSCTIL